jgi:hypothetical protein
MDGLIELTIPGFTEERKEGDKPKRLVDSTALVVWRVVPQVHENVRHMSTREDPLINAMPGLNQRG